MQNKYTLFIAERTIKAHSIINENVEAKVIRLTIKEIQDLELFPILKDKLYGEVENEIVKRKQDSNYVMDEKIKNLLDSYIKDFLIYATLLNITTPLNYKYGNKGVSNITDANADNIVGGQIENAKKFYRTRYDTYRKRLIDFVNESCGANTTVAPFSTGWYLTKSIDVVKASEANHYKTGR